MATPEQAAAVRAALITLVKAHGPTIASDVKRTQALLKDSVPWGRHAAAIVAALREGIANQLTASLDHKQRWLELLRGTERLFERSGLERNLARWSVETWALALNIVHEYEVSHEIRCTQCAREARADIDWVGKLAICPQCKSQLRVAVDFTVALVAIGETAASPASQTTALAQRWILIDESAADALPDEALRQQICQILARPDLFANEKSTRLEFPRTIAVLQEVALSLLEGKPQSSITFDAIVLGVLEGLSPQPGLFFGGTIPTNLLAELMAVCSIPAGERVLAIIDLGVFSGSTAGVVFTASGFHICNRSASKHGRTAFIDYADLRSCEFTSDGLQTIRLSQAGPHIDLAESGVSKRLLLDILNLLRSLAARVGSPAV